MAAPRTEERDAREDAWIARAKAGDRAAFASLYRLHAERLFAQVLMPRLANRAASEDALADTFRTALEKLHRFEPRGKGLYPWLATLARHRAIDLLRARGRSARAIERIERALGPEEGADGPDTHIDRERLRTEVGRVLAELNPRYRRAIELRIFEERERAECAERMGVAQGTFDVLVLRAVRAFRKAWDAHGGRGEEGA